MGVLGCACTCAPPSCRIFARRRIAWERDVFCNAVRALCVTQKKCCFFLFLSCSRHKSTPTLRACSRILLSLMPSSRNIIAQEGERCLFESGELCRHQTMMCVFFGPGLACLSHPADETPYGSRKDRVLFEIPKCWYLAHRARMQNEYNGCGSALRSKASRLHAYTSVPPPH